MRYLILSFLVLSSCARKDETKIEAQSLLQSAIPDGSCHIYTEGGLPNGEGWHEFKDGRFLQVQAWDCGMRETQRCFYFVHYPDASETRCE